MTDSTTVIVFLGATLVVGLLIIAVIFLTKKNGKQLNVSKYQSRWLAIESSLKRNEQSSWTLGVMNADKLVGHALLERGFKGETMGERMKAAGNVWKNADHVWGAHKIRNKLAHEPDAQITYETASRSLVAFKQALKDLGAI